MVGHVSRVRVLLAASAVVAAVLPVTFDEGRLVPVEACADGACCREDKSICVVGTVYYTNLYAATRPGATTCYANES